MGSGIRDWPEEDRPREKLLSRGADALTDPELLAILLRTGTGGASALDLARTVWAAFGGSWDGLAQAAGAEIARHPGLGPAKAAAVLAALEIGRRMGSRRLAAREPFRASRQVYEHFSGRLREVKKERFYCLLLDARNRLLREERVSEGTLTQSLVHPREAFRAAVREAASAVIFAHNHPSGDPTPSADDRDLTRRLWEAGRLLGIRVLDHVVLGDGRYYSFADEGEFPPA